jgi:saccharopine dehydrogenase-like NADP-dependent oxidoreductase
MVADLAFTSEDPRELDILAKNNGSLLIYDIGIAPGMSNILIGKVQNDASKVDRVRIWVGGNPQKPDADWSYMAPFSPSDVIEEYTRPARIRRGGKNIAAPALTERHSVQVTGYGEMEAFLTDGLRSLLDTILCDDLAEYTVRWPGHIQRYIDLDPINEEELIESWKFNSTRPEFTWLAVEIHADGEMHRWEIIDEGQGGWSSMARTTGLVTIEVVEMMIEGVFTQFGVLPPEALHEHADRFIAMMKGNGVKIINNHSSSSE